MIDALRYLSKGQLQLSLDRYVQIDIDDIFVGKTGIRMVPADVQVRWLTFLSYLILILSFTRNKSYRCISFIII